MSDWLVSTDISRFYPTIYTHSLPWAAYGKERVKDNLKLYTGSLADRLDVLVRACNRNQTIGIPIGPETSRIIAEVISARIDKDFSDSNIAVASERVDRLQDDWQIGAASLAQAEAILAEISRIYAAYGLEINGSKTRVERINVTRDSDWVIELGNFLAHRSGAMKGARLRAFLDLAVKHMATEDTPAVGNYVLAVLEGYGYDDGDVAILESFLLKMALTSPGSMDRICRMLLSLNHKTKKISIKRVCNRCVELVDHYLERDHRFEIIWLLTTLRGLRAPIRLHRVCEVAPQVESSAIILLLLDMKNLGLGLGTLPVESWINQATPERVQLDWTWLYAYEAIRHGWIPDKYRLMSKDFFRPMASRNVAFYDSRRNVVSSFAARQKAWSARAKELAALQKMFRSLRGDGVWAYW